MIKVQGPLRASIQYPPQPKPETVEVGQVWRLNWAIGKERPFVVVEITEGRGCGTWTFDKIVPIAVFRKGARCEVGQMLKNERWEFLGNIQA